MRNGEPQVSSRSLLSRQHQTFFFEWAAIIPLVIYLASYKFSHTLVGKTSLTGRLYIGLFPKLGILGSVASLLNEGSDYLDRVCSISELKKEVWDANFGGTFTCANGAASALITSYATKGRKPISVESTTPDSGPTSPPKDLSIKHQPEFRRYQTLHVFQYSRTNVPRTITDKLLRWHFAATFKIVMISGLMACAVVAVFFGLLGTAVAILTSACIQVCCQLVRIQRPGRFLDPNELGQACMLTSLHNNATTWYLFAGDRGIVDGILNKSMIYSISGKLGDTSTKVLASIFATLELLQLLSMTYVASQKGWDGIGMLILVISCWIWEKAVYSEKSVVREWITEAGIDISVTTFEFSGRTPMLGAIQLWKQNPIEVWMDNILQPTPRRQVWLSYLAGTNTLDFIVGLEKSLDRRDKRWVTGNASRTKEALKIWKEIAPLRKSIVES
ncbi:hypothetical protein G7Y89_g8866 [Cudoniella acicularis]|uniref:Uncharacterized protein n=1 Tax=Cudoniella acicularis TaxID=354080 RepID=A0A8H4W2H2_9HELO|nr:hypothetical protein G7Y89_g8866 [Cudoniella acicularis]